MITRRKFVHSVLATSASLAITQDLFSNIKNSKRFQLDLGVCTNIDNSSLVKKHGYNFLEETVSKFLIPSESDEKYALNLAKLKDSGINLYAVNSFLPGSLKCVGPDDNTEAILKYAETTFRRMEQASFRIIVFGSGGSRKIPDGFDKAKAKSQFVEINKKIAPLAKKYNVTVVLEPLNYGETNLLNTLEEGIEFVNEINHPNIQVLADFYHMLKNGEQASSIVKAGKLLKHAHLAEKENRTAPGIVGDDFRPFLAALKEINYKGKLAIECRWKDMEAELPLALKTVYNQINSI